LRVGRAYLSVALAVAVAVAYGVWVGPYWEADAAVLAVLAFGVAFLCFAERSVDRLFDVLTFGLTRANKLRATRTRVAEPTHREHIPRSRIAHYVTVSRIKSTAFIARESDSSFERALLSRREWRTLSGGGLEEITRKVTDASAGARDRRPA
jgi:hypothetical protein